MVERQDEYNIAAYPFTQDPKDLTPFEVLVRKVKKPRLPKRKVFATPYNIRLLLEMAKSALMEASQQIFASNSLGIAAVSKLESSQSQDASPLEEAQPSRIEMLAREVAEELSATVRHSNPRNDAIVAEEANARKDWKHIDILSHVNLSFVQQFILAAR